MVKMCERPYLDVESMNEAMIEEWKERVQTGGKSTRQSYCAQQHCTNELVRKNV